MMQGPSGAPSSAHPGDRSPSAYEGADRVGRYELIRRLGSGGMAEVHLARASAFQGFEKLVVLKRILPHLSADPHFVQMFLAEARLAAILDHPNVVQVFDLGVDDDHYFFTMEFVYGENLQTILRAGQRRGMQLPYPLAIAIAVGAAAGLHYAHERVGWEGQPLGLVHRDVSPTNVMVTYDGCVKVADFGIAKVTSRTDVTRAGMRKGKVPYMSPEQCRAQKIDRRSDIFALGILLYECSTGTRLFDGDNEFGVMNRIVTGDIPLPSTRRANYPKELERIVMRALRVDPNQRYATAKQMQDELERLARERKLDAGPSAMAGFMHALFNPQPFPWGAMQGSGVTGAAGLVTAAGFDALASQSGGGTAAGAPDVTPSDAASWASASRSRHGSAGSIASVKEVQRQGQLRGMAMGLSIAAGLAVLAVGGLWMATRESGGEPAPAANMPTAPAALPAAAPSAGEAREPAPAELPGLPPEDPAEAPGPAAAEAIEEPGEAPPTDEEVLLVIEEEAKAGSGRPAESTKEPSSSKRPPASRGGDGKAKPKKGKKKPDIDAFLPQ